MKVKATLLSLALGCSGWAHAASLDITVIVPEISTSQYYRPYVSVWVEDAQQKPVKLITVWTKEEDWLKDMRRFWRKIGRSDRPLVDAMSGATRTPGTYRLQWDGKDDAGKVVPAGSYTLYVEAAREKGGRTLQKVDFTLDGTAQRLTADGAEELGELVVNIQ